MTHGEKRAALVALALALALVLAIAFGPKDEHPLEPGFNPAPTTQGANTP
jgi:hypothetical protein